MSYINPDDHSPYRCHEHHGLVRDFGGERPRIVCLCGSTRFVGEFNRQRKALTEAGQIVLSIEVVTTQARADDRNTLTRRSRHGWTNCTSARSTSPTTCGC